MTDPAGNRVDNGGLVHLTDGRCSLLISTDGGMPRLVHWGAPLGDTDQRVMGALERPVPRGGLDVDPPLGIVAEASVGWFGTPGIGGHRPDGSDFAPRFVVRGSKATDNTAHFDLADVLAGLSVSIVVTLQASGVATFAVSLTNEGVTPYTLDALRLSLPVCVQATELFTVGGR